MTQAPADPARQSPDRLRLGRISYLNVLPLFDALTRDFPEGPEITYIAGHPSQLNKGLLEGAIDLAPASSFAYLANPDGLALLPGLSISAATGPIQSVLLISPVPLADLPAYVAAHGARLNMSTASASSVALLKVLWRLAWNLPEPVCRDIPPATGLTHPEPFLEIGDAALKLTLDPPPGRHVIDLGQAWKDFTGLPFVFAVWIVRTDLTPAKKRTLARLAKALTDIKAALPNTLPGLVKRHHKPPWLTSASLAGYFDVVSYDLDPERAASLIVFGDACQRLGLITSVPALAWITP